MNNKFILLALMAFLCIAKIGQAQGPPIVTDKAIMLGSDRKIARNLTEFKSFENNSYVKSSWMMHYLPTRNTLVAVHIPFVKELNTGQSISLGDIQLKGKYQFFRKDGTGKTLRMAVAALETLPTGKNLGQKEISRDVYQSYKSVILGYESLKYGLGIELGYNMVSNLKENAIVMKGGVGLPLLKPEYPLRQINLYFEYTSMWEYQNGSYDLMYSQGFQFAMGPTTIEIAAQFPIYQIVTDNNPHVRSIFIGSRHVF